jgi:CDP-diacylglycerol---serine O-phosphatidyltransferase
LIRHFLNPPNWFTAASILCATLAMVRLVGHEPDPQTLIQCCILIMFGGVFDMLDGRVARMTNRFSEFGVQLDSFADLIAFGLAPAMVAYAWKLHELGTFGALVAFWYVIAASFRLARFNVNAAHHSWVFAGHTQGLTSTMSGGCLSIFVWLGNGYLRRLGYEMPPMLVAAVVSWAGLMMVSSIPFRSFKDLRKNPRARVLFALGLAGCLSGAILFDPSMWFGAGAALYLGLGLIDGLVTTAYYNRKGLTLDTVGVKPSAAAAAAILPEDQEDDEDDSEELDDEPELA